MTIFLLRVLLIYFSITGLALLGKIDEQFVEVTPVYEPLEDGKRHKAFISKVGSGIYLPGQL